MIEEKIKAILSQVKENPTAIETLSDDTDIINDIGLDSLQMVTFVLKLEEELGIEIDFDSFDFSHLSSIKSLSEFLSNQ
ncbi:MAG: acyl carrier protein [Limnoraphis sp. WC205]|jgi:acyl carrier protein|nr:acyl carrier protein [Limnoraphis sp. WC205]